jgi:hypothetical protein
VKVPDGHGPFSTVQKPLVLPSTNRLFRNRLRVDYSSIMRIPPTLLRLWQWAAHLSLAYQLLAGGLLLVGSALVFASDLLSGMARGPRVVLLVGASAIIAALIVALIQWAIGQISGREVVGVADRFLDVGVPPLIWTEWRLLGEHSRLRDRGLEFHLYDVRITNQSAVRVSLDMRLNVSLAKDEGGFQSYSISEESFKGGLSGEPFLRAPLEIDAHRTRKGLVSFRLSPLEWTGDVNTLFPISADLILTDFVSGRSRRVRIPINQRVVE